jgi:hypothetical protein
MARVGVHIGPFYVSGRLNGKKRRGPKLDTRSPEKRHKDFIAGFRESVVKGIQNHNAVSVRFCIKTLASEGEEVGRYAGDIAAMIAAMRAEGADVPLRGEPGTSALDYVARDLCGYFAAENPSFDAGRFLADAGVKP